MTFYDGILRKGDEHMRALKRAHKERAEEPFRPLECAGAVGGKEREAKERAGMTIAEMVADNLAHPEQMAKERVPGSVSDLVLSKQEEERRARRTNKALDAMEQETRELTASVRGLLARLEERGGRR
jgi:hypothetical protein